MKERRIPAIKDGTVIDHIPSRDTFRIIRILNPQEFKYPINLALNLNSKKIGSKGVIKIDSRFLTQSEVNKIAILAPKYK
jgi:aspartate carbamoyltransferase regulatory subunit